MNNKKYFLAGGIIVFLTIASIILLSNSNKDDWTNEITKAQSYQITMTDCNNREKILDNSVLNLIKDKWDILSNNGPWTGNTAECHTKISFVYETNGIIQTKEILIIDETSLALVVGNKSTYYTNAQNIISELNTLFKA